MALEKDVDCPSCGETRSFYRTAATTLHLGEKTKWRCPECGYGFVELDGISTLPA
jgi:transposase-like protein